MERGGHVGESSCSAPQAVPAARALRSALPSLEQALRSAFSSPLHHLPRGKAGFPGSQSLWLSGEGTGF